MTPVLIAANDPFAALLPLGFLLIFGVIVVAVVVIVLVTLLGRGRAPAYPFVRQPVMTEAEIHFFRHIVPCIPQGTYLLSKVRLADFLQVTVRGNDYMRYFSRIGQKHADFLLIDARTCAPLLVVELDDSSHRRNARTMESDHFKDNAFAAAGLPILRVKTARQYDMATLRQQMRASIGAAEA